MVSLFGFGARRASSVAPQTTNEKPDIVRDFRADADIVSQRIATAFLLYIDEGVRAHGGKIAPVSFDRRGGTLYVEMQGGLRRLCIGAKNPSGRHHGGYEGACAAG